MQTQARCSFTHLFPSLPVQGHKISPGSPRNSRESTTSATVDQGNGSHPPEYTVAVQEICYYAALVKAFSWPRKAPKTGHVRLQRCTPGQRHNIRILHLEHSHGPNRDTAGKAFPKFCVRLQRCICSDTLNFKCSHSTSSNHIAA